MPSTRSHTPSLVAVFGLFAVAVIAGVCLFLLADEVFERERTLPADAAAATFAAAHATQTLTTVMRFVSDCGKPLVVGVLSIPLALWLATAHSHRRLLAFTATMAGGALVNIAAKQHFHRLRPHSVLASAPGYSFPSGHALGATLFYGSLAYVLYFTFEHRQSARILAASSCFLMVLAVGASRIYLGVHYLTDVTAGWLAALCWLCICIGSTEAWVHARDRRRARAGARTTPASLAV
jgi:undecaprenyl-diphosphatase